MNESKRIQRRPERSASRLDGAFRPLAGVTLWCLGVLVALMAGMLSAYLLVSALWVGSKIAARLRRSGAGPPESSA